MGRAANITASQRKSLANLAGRSPLDRFGLPLMEGGTFTHSTFLPPVYRISRIEMVLDHRILQQYNLPPGVPLMRVEASARWSIMCPGGQAIEQIQMVDYPEPPAADNGNGNQVDGSQPDTDESPAAGGQGDGTNGTRSDDTQGPRPGPGDEPQLPPGPRRIVTTD